MMAQRCKDRATLGVEPGTPSRSKQYAIGVTAVHLIFHPKGSGLKKKKKE